MFWRKVEPPWGQIGSIGESDIAPLTPREALALSVGIFGRFTRSEIASFVDSYPSLAWRVRGTNYFAIGQPWRRRGEIGEIMEVSAHASSYREPLARRLLQAFAESGTKLVVLGHEESRNTRGFYNELGFQTVDRIIEYRRHFSREFESGTSSPDILIRKATEDDFESILEIERESFPWLWWNSAGELEYYSRMQGVETYLSFNGSFDSQPIGYSGITIYHRLAHLDRLAVRVTSQRRGHGSALVEHALNLTSRRGVIDFSLSTQADNYRSQALYDRYGFKRTGADYDIRGVWLNSKE